ncbi:ABC transporter permease [Ottowia pentelensis]|uniref:ABC transporter permease n=2 Tax=Ottowia pentelensis TaxID=511108 RepID=A0ABV6PU00_9BURK|nr:iron export ABC transporter permease subunit FetB [Ottowia sp.]
MSAPPITPLMLAAAALLVLLDAGLSLALGLGMARALLVAALRTVVQLLLVGLVLKWVFAAQSPWLVAAVAALMLAAAGREIWARQQRRLTGWWGWGLGAGVATLATLLAAGLGVSLLAQRPWWSPQVLIPLLGMVLGQVMNGVSVTLNAFTASVVRERPAIEARLALGATRRQALGGVQRAALRGGLIPIINQMSAAGIITLPGMMTGQILAGLAPFEAAKYQILMLLLLAGGAGLGAIAVSHWAVSRVTDGRDRLRLDRLAPERR